MSLDLSIIRFSKRMKSPQKPRYSRQPRLRRHKATDSMLPRKVATICLRCTLRVGFSAVSQMAEGVGMASLLVAGKFLSYVFLVGRRDARKMCPKKIHGLPLKMKHKFQFHLGWHYIISGSWNWKKPWNKEGCPLQKGLLEKGEIIVYLIHFHHPSIFRDNLWN